jgi:hypothetical protein
METQKLLHASRDDCLEINAEEAKRVLLLHRQQIVKENENAEIANRYIKNMANFKKCQ